MRRRARRGCRVALRRVGRRNRPDCSGTQEAGWSTADLQILKVGVAHGRRGGAALRASFCLAWRPTHATWARATCSLEVRAGNEGAQAFYESLGFRPHRRAPALLFRPRGRRHHGRSRCRWRPATWLAWRLQVDAARADALLARRMGASMAKKARFCVRFPAPARRLFRKITPGRDSSYARFELAENPYAKRDLRQFESGHVSERRYCDEQDGCPNVGGCPTFIDCGVVRSSWPSSLRATRRRPPSWMAPATWWPTWWRRR